jgi:membrane-associated phospholipid phosphatase
MAVIFIIASALGLWLTNIRIEPIPLAVRWLPPGLFLLLLFYYRWRRERRIQGLLTIVLWSFVFSVLYSAPMYIAARLPVEFHDHRLAQMDKSIGIELPTILHGLESFPRCKWFLDHCYDSLLIFVTIAIMVPPVCGHMQRSKEYVVAGVASALIAYPLFAMLPALGPWTYYQYPASIDQQSFEKVIVALKNPDPFVLNYLQIQGIITFPSFHTALAMLAAFALWPVRYLRWPAVLLAGLITVSTITTGWHYLTDVLAGALVAGAACMVGRGYSWCERRALEAQASPIVTEELAPGGQNGLV